MHVFRAKGLPKSPKKLLSQDWFQLKRFELKDSSTITFVFESDAATIETSGLLEFLRETYGQLNLILPESELPPLPFSGLDHVTFSRALPDRALARFRARAFLTQATVPEDVEARFREFVKFPSAVLDVSTVGSPDFFDAVLSALVFVPAVNEVVIPGSETTHWAAVWHFLRSNVSVRSLVTYEPIDESFVALTEVFDPFVSGVRSLTLGARFLHSGHIRALGDLCQELKIVSLSLLGGFPPGHGASVFKMVSVLEQLRAFAIEGLKDFTQFDMCFSQIPQVESFALRSSGIELSLFLMALERKGLALKQLDLSGNVATRPLVKTVGLPLSLERFVVDDVEFRPDSLEAMMKSLFQVRKPLALSLCRLPVKGEDLDTMFKGFLTRCPAPRAGYPLSEFYWDDNPFGTGIMQVLQKCRQLKVLSLRGVTGDEAALADLLTKNPTITELRIGPTKSHPLEQSLLSAVLKTLEKQNRVLTVLDLGQTQFTADVLAELRDLLFANRVITTLISQGCGLAYAPPLLEFFTDMLERGVGLAVTIPRSDIEAMWPGRAAEGETELGELLTRVKAGNSGILIPREALELEDEAPAAAGDEGRPEEGMDIEVKRPPAGIDQTEFQASIEPVPPPNNEALLRAFSQRYSLASLITQLKMDKETRSGIL
jgi:hypothetical protein